MIELSIYLIRFQWSVRASCVRLERWYYVHIHNSKKPHPVFVFWLIFFLHIQFSQNCGVLLTLLLVTLNLPWAFLCGVCRFSLCLCVSKFTSFFPQFTNTHVQVTDDFKLSIGVSVSVHGCLSCFSLCGPVMESPPVQGLLHHSPNDIYNILKLLWNYELQL